MRVTWRSIAPIFADIVLSPWNLLVGGLLIQHLSVLQACLAIMLGYMILGTIFVLYGGLGYKKRKLSSQILASVFGSKIATILIPILLAVGQIGWGGINIDLGGKSFAHLLGLPIFYGLLIYTVILIAMAMLNLARFGFIKFAVTISALFLMGYLFVTKIHLIQMTLLIHYSPKEPYSLFWGVSIVVASLISFATVTPDFFRFAKRKQDILIASILGLMPGVATAMLGVFLFVDKPSLSLVSLLSITTLPFFPHLFNVITNTDGATALYTPALKLQNIFPLTFQKGVLISGTVSFFLAILQIASYVTLWLTILSIVFPVFIGVCFAALLFKNLSTKPLVRKDIFVTFYVSLGVTCALVWFFPPVIFALLTPLLFFSISLGYAHLILM